MADKADVDYVAFEEPNGTTNYEDHNATQLDYAGPQVSNLVRSFYQNRRCVYHLNPPSF